MEQKLGKRKAGPSCNEKCMDKIVEGINGLVERDLDLTDPQMKVKLVREYLLGILEEAGNTIIDNRIASMLRVQAEMNRLAQENMIREDQMADIRFKVEAAIEIGKLFERENLSRSDVSQVVKEIKRIAQQNDLQDFIVWAEEHESTAYEIAMESLKQKYEDLFEKVKETAISANEMVTTVAKPSLYFLMTIICSMPDSCQVYLENALNAINLGWLHNIAITYCGFWKTQTGLFLYQRVTGMTREEKNALFEKLSMLTESGCIRFSGLLNALVSAASRSVSAAADLAKQGAQSVSGMYIDIKEKAIQYSMDSLLRAFGTAAPPENIEPVQMVITFGGPDEESQYSTQSDISVVNVERFNPEEALDNSSQVVVTEFVNKNITPDEEMEDAKARIEARAEAFFNNKNSTPPGSPISSQGYETASQGYDTASQDSFTFGRPGNSQGFGGRRRKSRRHKKRRSTLKKRQIKRRLSRKGKKRKYTKKH